LKETVEAAHRSEDMDRLARTLKAGTAFLSPDKVRHIIGATKGDAKDSLEIIDRLNTEVWEEARRIALEFEEAMLAWEQQDNDSDIGHKPEVCLEPIGKELLGILDEIPKPEFSYEQTFVAAEAAFRTQAADNAATPRPSPARTCNSRLR
jgi:hypothetical protein